MMLLTLALSLLIQLDPAVRLEAEDGLLTGAKVAVSRPGFSGSGYVTDITSAGAEIAWKVHAHVGIYEVKIRYAAQSQKGTVLEVNGFRSSVMLKATGDHFGTASLGKVELKDGENNLAIQRGWGYYDVDYITFSPASKPETIEPLETQLTDKNATPEAAALYRRLLNGYGKKTASGQYDASECRFVQEKTGAYPAILGGDLIDFSPSRVARIDHPKDPIPGWIAAVRAGQILTLSWHWNAPKDLIDQKMHKKQDGTVEDASWYFGFYTRATYFSLAKALANKEGEDYKLLLRDIDAIAVQLKRLQEAHIPVLWRPLHESEGGWFWWGASGADNCKTLWGLMHDRLTKVHHLHNLIWVWNSPSPSWYPGDATVDVMSVDIYPDDRRDALSPSWDSLLETYNGRKPLALAEFPGAPDVERAYRFGVRWLYFVSWTGGVGPKSTDPAILKRTYTSPKVANRT